ncbi:MAG: AsmA-like C-terminal region-containing protein [Thermoguttaceae bacterium]
MPKRLINFCWFWFKWGLIASVVGAALLVPYLYHRMDKEIRRRVEELLAKQYPGLKVKVQRAVLMRGEGIALRDMSIIDPAAEGPGAELLSFDECFLACSTDLSDLCSGRLKLTRVIIRRPTLRMTRRPDGAWSSARLVPLPKLDDDALPEIRFENGTIEIFDPTKAAVCTLTLRDVNLTFAPIVPAEGQTETTHRLRVQGTTAGDYFRQVIFDGEVDIDRPKLNLAGKIDGVEISPELHNVLPDAIGCNLSMLGSLRGQTEARFLVCYDPASPERWKFDITGQLARGRIDDPRLPRPLTEIRATVHVDNQGFAIQEFKARSNQATLSLTCSGGLKPSSPMAIDADVSQLPLDEQLLAILPGKLQEEWQKLRPEGLVDASVRLRYDGRGWQPQVRIQCQNVSFAHYKFPYRLEHGNGLLELKDDRLQMNLSTFSENQLVHIVGEIRNPMNGPTGWLRVRSDGLPIDEKLLKALPPPAQSLARSMDLKGTIAFEYELAREIAEGAEHQHLQIRASRCGLRYDRFPYAISNVHGELEMIDGNWWFRNLEGYNGTSRVTGDGTLARTPQGNELALRLCAANVPLEGELRDALQPGMRQVWALLQPRGIIDITANVRYIDELNLLDVAVRAEPRSETCSLEPVRFPYRLENVQGVFTYGSGRVTFERFSAWHGPVKMACNGTCSFQPDGGWQLSLDRLSVDRLRMDRQFMQALPPQLKKGLGELNATGPMSLQGSILLARGANPAEPMTSRWNLSVGLNQVGVDCGVRLENIYGNVGIAGWTDGTRFQMRGELALDSLTCRDHQFTQVLGPFWIDDQEAMFGSWVARRDNRFLPRGQPPVPLRPVIAKIVGGTVYGDGWASIGPQPRYSLQANLVDADLATCARELASNNRNLRGRIRGTAELHGFGHSRTAMGGHGSLHLLDANIYELPVMISMLKILSIKMPDPNAFSQSDIDFRIEGEHVYFDKLDFKGDAISLSGKGEMNFQGDTDMVLAATVGHADAGLQAVHNFFSRTSQLVMQIRVHGNLQNPDIKEEVLPGVNQALKSLDSISRTGM